MKILMYGDSITDMGRSYARDNAPDSYGYGYVYYVASDLFQNDPAKYEIINRGVGGSKITSLYAQIKQSVWNLQPDVLSILCGVNDLWHDLDHNDGVELERWEKIYRMMIEDTIARLPNVKIIVCEPFVLKGCKTEANYEGFLKIKEYAKVAKKLAEEYRLHFLPLQERLDEAAGKYNAEVFLYDGVHPNIAGARLIADEWLKLFKNEIETA
ncbi:MAG: lysophospholipase [Clostridia bacterium]|nr:lysophospholipase [Clostridia bacterium]